MRSRFVIAVVGVLVSIACGSQPTASSDSTAASSRIDCVDVQAPHRAYVVVQHMSGAWMQRCIGFAGEYIDGQTIMDRSGIEYHAEPVSSGKVVCQVDLEPRQFAACFPLNQPYWALFVESGGHWSTAPSGFTDVRLRDGDSLGWHYVRASDPAPAPPPLPKKV